MIRRRTSSPNPSARERSYSSVKSAPSGPSGRTARRHSAPGWTTPPPAPRCSRPASPYFVCGSDTSTISAPRLAQTRPAPGPTTPDLRRHAVLPVFPRHADAQPLHPAAACGREVRHRTVGGGAVLRIEPGHRIAAAVAQSATERPNGARVVQRGGERHHAVAAAPAIGRLDPGDPAQRRRLPDRAAGIGPRRAHRQPGRDRRRRPAGRAARHQQHGPGGDQGLVTGPHALLMLDEPMANSSMLVLPRNTAPSRSRLAVTVLS